MLLFRCSKIVNHTSRRIFSGCVFCFIIALNFGNALGQSRNSIWCFGDSAGIDFSNTQQPTTFSTSMDSRGSCVSIADSIGQLLFYANTRANGSASNSGIIYNRNNQVMINGDSIAGRAFYDEMIIIPKPDNDHIYYLFSINIYTNYPVGTFLSIIDMDGDNGLGEVISKNNLISADSISEAMTAVKHANGVDWWLIIKGYSTEGDSTFYEYLITADTIQRTIINMGGYSWTSLGVLTFDKTGQLLAYVSFCGLIETFNFNRCTGQLYNRKIIHPQYVNNIAWYSGASFSPNSNILYISDANDSSHIFQFDLTSLNIWSSRDTLATVGYSRGGGGNLRLAPDDKIYWTYEWDTALHYFPYPYNSNMYSPYNMNLSVIENPDILGSGCNLNLFSFYLGGKRTYWGLPNNPDYELGPLATCDSTTSIAQFDEISSINIFPNPVIDGRFTIEFPISDSRKSLSIISIDGREIYHTYLETGLSSQLIKLPEIATGTYITKISINGKSLCKLIIEK